MILKSNLTNVMFLENAPNMTKTSKGFLLISQRSLNKHFKVRGQIYVTEHRNVIRRQTSHTSAKFNIFANPNFTQRYVFYHYYPKPLLYIILCSCKITWNLYGVLFTSTLVHVSAVMSSSWSKSDKSCFSIVIHEVFSRQKKYVLRISNLSC